MSSKTYLTTTFTNEIKSFMAQRKCFKLNYPNKNYTIFTNHAVIINQQMKKQRLQPKLSLPPPKFQLP